MQAIFAAVEAALIETDPLRKCELVAALDWPEERGGEIPPLASNANNDPRIPGRPARPELVHPSQVPHRGLGTADGRAALLHAVAHIEFNAINLALDACWRFRGMPDAFRCDWLSVARDEARHFVMLSGRLSELGHAYGDFPAHNGLWEAAEKTRDDVLVRMALVPRVLEARGLDVTPGMMARLQQVGDLRTVGVLRVILQEEVRHVAIGTRWYRTLCAQRNLDPVVTFRALLSAHGMRLRPPLNLAARAEAGFDERELAGVS